MRIEIFKELRPYTISELQTNLLLDENEINDLIKTLSLMNIIRRISKSTSTFELEELFGAENLLEINNRFEGEVFVFKYVGMLTLKSVCIVVYPKYMDSYLEDKNNGYKKLRQLIAVIRKYQAKSQNQSTSIGEEREYNSLAITLALIEDYLENGLYTNDRQIIEENGLGEILWEKTLNESTVYFSNDIPLYLDLFTTNQESNEKDFFRQLHRIVISFACRKIEDVLSLIGVDPVILTDSKLSTLGSEEYLLNRINQELSVQFVTRKQSLLKLIKSYITNEEGSQVEERVSFVGTNSFNLVWEDICSDVYDDCINKSIQEMGFKFSGDSKYSATLADVIEKPVWIHRQSGETHIASKTLIPDIISIRDESISIYDAKYYKIILDGKTLRNNPGVGDVTKQYLYELAYRNFALENNLEIISNAFLMPTDLDDEVRLGTASMSMFQSIEMINLNDIEVILLPSKKMFDLYLNK